MYTLQESRVNGFGGRATSAFGLGRGGGAIGGGGTSGGGGSNRRNRRPAVELDNLPSCRSVDFPGTHGTIWIQTNRLGYVSWGIYMHDAVNNDGPWTASIWVGGIKEDGKDQTYPPHGSVSSVKARPGEVLTIDATHIDWLGRPYRSVPNACVIPLP